MKELAAEIAKMSTVSTIDAMAMLEAFKQIIPQHLADGKIVRLGDFGTFMTTINSQGEETADKVSSGSIKNTNLRFRAGEDFKNTLKVMKYERANG